MQKILIISPNPSFGGAATANMAIAAMLSNAGYQVIYNDEYYPDDEYGGLKIFHYNIHEFGIKSDFRLWKFIKNNNVDVVIWGNTLLLCKYFFILNKLRNNKIKQIAIFHSLNLDDSLFGKLVDCFRDLSCFFIDKYVYVSEYTRKSWMKFPVNRMLNKRGVVINNPISAAAKRHSITSSGKIRVGFVGRFSNEKRPDLFCSLSSSDDFCYVAYGNGPLLEEMKDKYESVSFMGYCSDVEEIYANIDILVMTSKFENCPMAILESKSRGIPCVAPAVGGIPEIVQNNVDGIVLKEITKESINNALHTITKTYGRFSENCMDNANRYNADSVKQKWFYLLK